MDKQSIIKAIVENRTSLGIEFGSTRIKAVLVTWDNQTVATGSHQWENRLVNGIWTYSLDDVWAGLQSCYKELASEIKNNYNIELKYVGSLGISAMMHGYLVFDKDGNQLTEFRTWRNTITEASAEILTKEFNFNIPERWSIAHLYQAILNNEEHVKDIAFITTLAGYVHWKLTGEKVLGIGDASGMFPINSSTNDYDEGMLLKFNELIKERYHWSLKEIMPKPLLAGLKAGFLSDEGAGLIDPSGMLSGGIPLCPPEGDAGTGMVATNSVAIRTGNISAGTSVFLMAVLEKTLSKVYPEIDMVTTPTGKHVAMVHCNNCTSDINAWVELLKGFLSSIGIKASENEIYESVFSSADLGDKDCGGVISYNYFSGESITRMNEGRPLLARMPNAKFSFENFSRNLLCSAVATLKIGTDILFVNENVKVDVMFGHGGFFKNVSGQKVMSSALNIPVAVMETAGEGGPWGMAILASYMQNKSSDEKLEDYLTNKVFKGFKSEVIEPSADDVNGFNEYMKLYQNGLSVECEAINKLR